MALPEIQFHWQPKQAELIDLLDNQPGVVNIGFGGPRGGGKSKGVRDAMLWRRIKWPRTTGWLIRRTFGDVYDNHVKKYFEERPYMRQWYSAQERTFKLPNGSEIKARYGEHEGDIQSEYGKEAMDIFVDQAEQFSEADTNFLRTCRRNPSVQDGLCKMVSTINPGGLSHAYMKRIFIDKLYVGKERPSSFAFVEAAGWDNVEWVRQALEAQGFTDDDFYDWDEERRFHWFITQSQYGRDMDALPETMRIQQLLGRWDFFEGQVFPELGRVHDLDQYVGDDQIEDFVRHLRRIGGFDHASTGITAYSANAVDVDENFFVFDGYYQANRLISEHAEGIKRVKSRYGEFDYQVADPSTEGKTLQNRDEMFSVQDAYRREGLLFVSAHRSSISVGIDLLKEMLKVNPLHRNPFTQQLGSPRLFISRSRCADLWREMIDLQLISGNYVGADHFCDTVRYVAMSRPPKAEHQQRDVSKLPAAQRQAVQTHDKWAKGFDRAITGGGGSYW